MVPPLVQVDGGDDCGPNTVKVIVPVAPLPAPDSEALIELAPIAVPVVSVAGADTVVEVTDAGLDTTVEVMPDPQPLFDGWSLASPP